MYFNPVDGKFRAENCILNSYGVKEKTTGLAAFPCRACPQGLVTGTGATYPKSAVYHVIHTAFDHADFELVTPEGFTDPRLASPRLAGVSSCCKLSCSLVVQCLSACCQHPNGAANRLVCCRSGYVAADVLTIF
jgi:hypothetical protein